jgi:hypothetical protein
MNWNRVAAIAAALLTLLGVGNPAFGVTIQPGVQVGTVTQIAEISGLVSSRALTDTLWVHNDSGDSARFFAMSTAGKLLGTVTLTGASATDWEDIAIAPKPGGGNYLYLGDIGDNSANRTAGISIYRVTEPTSAANAAVAAANYTKVTLKYPDLVPRNAESLLVDPLSGDLFIVTKGPAARVYSAPATIFDTPGTIASLTSLGGLKVTLNNATAADISPNGLHILIRNASTTAYLFERSVGQTVAQALQSTPIPFTLKAETQGESIGWAADGRGFYTTSELAGTASVPVWYYAFTVPEPATLSMASSACVALAALAAISRRAQKSRVLVSVRTHHAVGE